MRAFFSSIDRFCHIHKIHYLTFIYTIFITVYYLIHKDKFKSASLKCLYYEHLLVS